MFGRTVGIFWRFTGMSQRQPSQRQAVIANRRVNFARVRVERRVHFIKKAQMGGEGTQIFGWEMGRAGVFASAALAASRRLVGRQSPTDAGWRRLMPRRPVCEPMHCSHLVAGIIHLLDA